MKTTIENKKAILNEINNIIKSSTHYSEIYDLINVDFSEDKITLESLIDSEIVDSNVLEIYFNEEGKGYSFYNDENDDFEDAKVIVEGFKQEIDLNYDSLSDLVNKSIDLIISTLND